MARAARKPLSLAVAGCIALPHVPMRCPTAAVGDDGLIELQLTPAGG